MKKSILLSFLFSLLSISVVSAQSASEKAAILNALVDNARYMKDQEMPVRQESPLNPDQAMIFKGLNYFKVGEKWRIPAQLQRDEMQVEETLMLSNGRPVKVMTYGTITFDFRGSTFSLTVYRDQNFPELAKEPGCLFVPFRDATSGNETYAGGRYLIVKIPCDGEKLLLDFNRIFNPYSAYQSKNVSVLAPDKNHLPISVFAGEKIFGQPAKSNSGLVKNDG